MGMGRAERLQLIQQIQATRQSRVVSYFCGDRKPIGAQIHEDALRPMYDHLRSLQFEGEPTASRSLSLQYRRCNGVAVEDRHDAARVLR